MSFLKKYRWRRFHPFFLWQLCVFAPLRELFSVDSPITNHQLPTFDREEEVNRQTGRQYIAGLDEAGRGALAGPVVAAAVIFPLDRPGLLKQLHEVNDSKQLTAAARERLYTLITEQALTYGVGWVAADVIDRVGILPATKQAMALALSPLSPAAEYLLVDGHIPLNNIPLPQQAIVRGDSLSLSIAAASILAKVSRDRHMVALDAQYPLYGFARHKGYGTQQHLVALLQHGPSPIHRYSFAPIRQRLL
jgi:ribonuclease HII